MRKITCSFPVRILLKILQQTTHCSKPYVDIDEWRDVPVRHRYIHGGFKGTDTRFSFYFPSKEQYQGQLFQYITPVPDNENLSQGTTGEEELAFQYRAVHILLKPMVVEK